MHEQGCITHIQRALSLIPSAAVGSLSRAIFKALIDTGIQNLQTWQFLNREQQADSDTMTIALSLDKNMMSQDGSSAWFSVFSAVAHANPSTDMYT